ncbi:MAG: hypothetical protein P9X27_01225 [Candidatus Kaelpia aquatica]|nr:hypothetical protein [Candidatus Kaelpia aquatica]
MADLLIVLFLIVFWVISYTLKQSGKPSTQYKEDNELEHLFRFPKLNIIPEALKQEDKKIEQRVISKIEPDQRSEVVKRGVVLPEHQTGTSKFDSGKLYRDMLESKTSLRNSIIIKEILDNPVSLR